VFLRSNHDPDSAGLEFSLEDPRAVVPAIRKAVTTMKKGEKVSLQVSPKYGYREGEAQAAGVTVDLELVSWKTVSFGVEEFLSLVASEY
jgi:FK506-binding protein 4/5